jgi:phage baseplate assembly protein W
MANNNIINRDFLGNGFSFPVRVNQRGGIQIARQEQDIAQAIIIILMTRKGERKMRPTFGCDIHELIFAPLDANTFGLAAYYVRDSLEMWEPRITVEDVVAFPDPEDTARMIINITYIIRATNDERNLVFPFYTIPEE